MNRFGAALLLFLGLVIPSVAHGQPPSASSEPKSDWLVYETAEEEYWLPPGWRFNGGCDIPTNLITVSSNGVPGKADRFEVSAQLFGRARVVSLYASHVSAPRRCQQLNLYLAAYVPTFATRRGDDGDYVRRDVEARPAALARNRRKSGSAVVSRKQVDLRSRGGDGAASSEVIRWDPQDPYALSITVYLPELESQAGKRRITKLRLEGHQQDEAAWDGEWIGCERGWCTYSLWPTKGNEGLLASVLRDVAPVARLDSGTRSGAGQLPISKWGDAQDEVSLFTTQLRWMPLDSDVLLPLEQAAVAPQEYDWGAKKKARFGKAEETFAALNELYSALLPDPTEFGLRPPKAGYGAHRTLDPSACFQELQRAPASSVLPESCQDEENGERLAVQGRLYHVSPTTRGIPLASHFGGAERKLAFFEGSNPSAMQTPLPEIYMILPDAGSSELTWQWQPDGLAEPLQQELKATLRPRGTGLETGSCRDEGGWTVCTAKLGSEVREEVEFTYGRRGKLTSSRWIVRPKQRTFTASEDLKDRQKTFEDISEELKKLDEKSGLKNKRVGTPTAQRPPVNPALALLLTDPTCSLDLDTDPLQCVGALKENVSVHNLDNLAGTPLDTITLLPQDNSCPSYAAIQPLGRLVSNSTNTRVPFLIKSQSRECLTQVLNVSVRNRSGATPASLDDEDTDAVVSWEGLAVRSGDLWARVGTVTFAKTGTLGEGDAVALDFGSKKGTSKRVRIRARASVRAKDLRVSLPLHKDFVEIPGLVKQDLDFLALGRPNLIWLPKSPDVKLLHATPRAGGIRACELNELVRSSAHPGIIFELGAEKTYGIEIPPGDEGATVALCYVPTDPELVNPTFDFGATLLVDEGRAGLKDLHAPPINLGQGSVELPRRSRAVYIPLNLRERAEIDCPRELPYDHGSLVRTIRRKNLDGCSLVVDIRPRDARLRVESRSADGAGAFSPIMREIGTQVIELDISISTTGLGKKTKPIHQVIPLSADYIVTSSTYSQGRVRIPLTDLREKLGNPGGYELIEISIQHASRDERPDELKDAVVPFGGNYTLDDVNASTKIRVLPRAAMRGCKNRDGPQSCAERTNYATRFFVSALGTVNALRYPNSGQGITVSSEYDTFETASFDYGVLGVLEGWNMSANEPRFRYFNPQLQVGILGPKSFEDANALQTMAFVAGIGFRPPTANKPGTPAPEVQVGPFLWGYWSPFPGEGSQLGVIVGLSLTFLSLAS